MANPEHLEILRRGVEVWNRWREENPDIKPNLREATLEEHDFFQANFSEVNFREARLKGANLNWAILNGSDLRNAELSSAQLRGASMQEAFLHSASLYQANLMGAILNYAVMNNANLIQADLRHTAFVGAHLYETKLNESNMMGAKLNEAKLGGAILDGANLEGVILNEANLHAVSLKRARMVDANLHRADLSRADLRDANLLRANLDGANLYSADLSGANLHSAILRLSDLNMANLTGANLSHVNLSGASLLETNLNNAILLNCHVYGISVWMVSLEGATQSDLIINNDGEPEITVDNLEIAQFVYMLLHNEKIRDVIDTLTTKSVLILGRFTDERKAVLDAIKNQLRQRNYVPILFDFEKPTSRDLTETVVTLAHLSRFVIADITDAKSIPQELQAIVPNLLSVPIQPIILAAQREYAMFEHFRRYPSVLALHEYDSQDQLIAELPEKVIEPAERKVMELRKSL